MADILIVDDKQDSVYILRTVFESRGHKVRQAGNGAEALTLAGDRKPDIIISDLLMPIMDGYALLQRLKSDEKLRDIPFIVYTATYTDSKDEKLARDLGADEFIIKPMDSDDLIEKLEGIIKSAGRKKSGHSKTAQPDQIENSKLYNEVLVRKLEEKAIQLEQANKKLQKEMIEREAAQRESEKLQNALLQSQKMEFVGRLAGGIAHDFNNMLTAIICSGEAMKEHIEKNPKATEMLSDILEAAERASAFTSQLLAFSRKQPIQPELTDLNITLNSMTKMLRRIIGEDIELLFEPHSSPCFAMVDEGQMSQVILNLAVNAKDAMKNGGHLKISASIINPEKDFFKRNLGVSEGPMVRLSFSDSGQGMTEDIKRHIFEPFFTTKGKGAGTGLGLATVYGIVRQAGGAIEVESRVNKGTTFNVYIPNARIDSEKVKKLPETDYYPETKCSETILFVEDENQLRKIWEKILEEKGYKVISAGDPYEAIEKAQKAGKIDLLITDVVMPGMNGKQLAEEIFRRNICGKALYMSGYTEEALIKHGIIRENVAFLQKPFSINKFFRKIRETIKDWKHK